MPNCKPIVLIAFANEPWNVTGGKVLVESVTSEQAEALALTPDEQWKTYTLYPVAGSEITLSQRETTDEGWSARTECVWYDSQEDIFRREWQEDGTDCDGRLTEGGALNSDGSIGSYGRTVWADESSHRRDYQAEAAGY